MRGRTHKYKPSANKIGHAKFIPHRGGRNRFFGIRTLPRLPLPHHTLPRARARRVGHIPGRAHRVRRVSHRDFERAANHPLARDIQAPRARQQERRAFGDDGRHAHNNHVQRADHRASVRIPRTLFPNLFRSALRRPFLYHYIRTFVHFRLRHHPRLFLGKQTLFCLFPHRTDRRDHYDLRGRFPALCPAIGRGGRQQGGDCGARILPVFLCHRRILLSSQRREAARCAGNFYPFSSPRCP